MATRNRAGAATPAARVKRSATVAQYRALRYWAACTNDRLDRGADPRPYTDRSGPAPQLMMKTIASLNERGWWMSVPHGWLVLDSGRAACGMPRVWRDVPCHVPGCHARIGERCRALREPRRPYTDLVHDERLTFGQASAPSSSPAAPAAGRRRQTVTMEDVLEALATCDPGLAARLRSPIEPRHIGLIIST